VPRNHDQQSSVSQISTPAQKQTDPQISDAHEKMMGWGAFWPLVNTK
jgi:hypothetical protein